MNVSTGGHPEYIGPYEVIKVIGTGGMGVVYEARQTEPVQRRVAVKIIRIGMDTHEIVGRFAAERQALAVMQHPGIATVFDAGASAEGRPYFVMELVEGERLDKYCDDNRLTVIERVELFVRLCEAVQHAHQKGVIHRDLKPNNVLVSGEGGRAEPKVIDFGIAKATERRLSDEHVETTHGMMLGTLAYMSPEQTGSDGLDVDTRADIYSLGVILYELLTGDVPLDPATLGFPAFLVRLTEKDTSWPTPASRLTTDDAEKLAQLASTRSVDPAELKKQVEGDLQWIVLKAIEKDRDRRYETVAALAEDLRRFLSNDVISARPPTVTYRFGKFVRRNRVGVSAAVVAFLALIAGTTAASVGLVRARQAERLAASEANRANREALLGERVSEFMVGLFQLADPGEARGNTVTAREILDEGAREIRGGLADEPQVQASLMLAMGRVYLGLGLPEAATGLLQSSLAIRRRVAGDLSPDVSESLEFLADADLQSGRYDEATEGYLQALDLRRQLSGDSANSVADVLSSLSLSTWRSGDLPTALDYGEQAAAIYRANGDDPVSLADALTNTGGVLFVTGDYEGAEALVREALRLTRGVHGSEHRAVARLLNNLALLLTFQRRFDEAEPLAREALSTLRRLHGDDHYSVATSALALAMLLRELGAYAESEQLAREAVEATRRVLGAQHPNTAEALSNLAWVLLDVGDNRGAEEAAGEAATILSAVLPPDNWRVAHVNSMRGAALGRLGDVEQAEPLLIESYEHLDSAEQGQFARAALQRVIDFYVARGDAAAADRYSARMADKYGDAGGR